MVQGWLDECTILGLTVFAELNSIRECLQKRRLEWFVYLEKIEECLWSSKCRTYSRLVVVE